MYDGAELRDDLDDLGIHLVQLNRGGFAAVAISALEEAEAITAKEYMKDVLDDLKSAAGDKLSTRLREDIEAEEVEVDDE